MARPTKPTPSRPADARKSGTKPAKAQEAVRAAPPPVRTLKRRESAPEPVLELAEAPAAAEPEAKRNRRASRTPLDELNPTLVHLGRVVRQARKAKDMTQMQVARICGFNSAAIFMVEAGRQNMTIKSLMAVASALGLQVGDLFPRSTPRTGEKLKEVAELLADMKSRVVTQLGLLDRLAKELREEAGLLD
jgi:transcriptional regulator with XRE-family HTH domain